MDLHLQLHKPPPFSLPAAVPCPSTLVAQLLLCFLLLSWLFPSHPMEPCTCSAAELPDPYHNLTVRGAFDQRPGYLFLTNMSTCTTTWQRVAGLASYIKAANQRPALDLSQKCWFFVRQNILLQQQISYGGDGLHEASFSVSFTMTAYYQPNTVPSSSVVFALEPLYFPVDSWGLFTPPNWQVLGPSSSGSANSSTAGSDGSRLSADIGTAQDKGELLYIGDIVWVQIGIEPPPAAGNSSSPVRASEYSVWIDYDHVGHRMSVYVDAGSEGTPMPANAVASKTLNITAQYALLGLLSSMGQLLQVHTWNSTVDVLPVGLKSPALQERAVVLYSVLGSVAAVAITTALVFLYLNSKYRRWKKEQDELTKIMQGIPGVPTHVDFADIKKATKNFHETMKLGKGGFGAVYRCTLPAGAGASSSRTRQAMDVAVKKFMREVDDRRCSDFLAEVSIINRLRHKNIVPLVGWSYNKGEPLLIYEYMTNGSLDQHVFQKSSAKQQRGEEEEEGVSDLRQWRTRYGIARDIATGLHYVHHEHEPMVLHRDIKASNIMLDSDFRARLGDFGIACAVAMNRSSVTGIAGTWGYIAPDYAMSYKATRQTDVYAFGVLILEVVTGKKNGDTALMTPDDDHITDWIWGLHGKGTLLEGVDASVLATCDGQQLLLGDDGVAADEAKRLLLLGLACTNPNPLDRPSMAEVLQVITKVRPPPEVPPEKPSFVWPPQDWRARNSVYSTAGMSSDWDGSSTSMVDLEQPSMDDVAGGQGSVRSRPTSGSRALQIGADRALLP